MSSNRTHSCPAMVVQGTAKLRIVPTQACCSICVERFWRSAMQVVVVGHDFKPLPKFPTHRPATKPEMLAAASAVSAHEQANETIRVPTFRTVDDPRTMPGAAHTLMGTLIWGLLYLSIQGTWSSMCLHMLRIHLEAHFSSCIACPARVLRLVATRSWRQ